VGGPTQSIGQELMKRLPAKTDWEGLYACGDSTTMGMGAPAVAASGFGAANVILRELGLEEYTIHSFERERILQIKHKNALPKVDSVDDNVENAKILARECQHCADRPCKICPAGIDIPLFMRRIEVGNFDGAINSILQMNPMPEICGYLCPAENYCQKVCYRNSFANKPVQIQNLHRWLAHYTRNRHKKLPINSDNDKKIAVVGAGIEGLTVSYYLSQLGYNITLYEKESSIGGSLIKRSNEGEIPLEVVNSELESLILPNIELKLNHNIGEDITIKDLDNNFDAVYIAWSGLNLTNKEDIKVAGYSKVFSNQKKISSDMKKEVSPLIGASRKAAMSLHELIGEKT
jgi:hypothetical protein